MFTGITILTTEDEKINFFKNLPPHRSPKSEVTQSELMQYWQSLESIIPWAEFYTEYLRQWGHNISPEMRFFLKLPKLKA